MFRKTIFALIIVLTLMVNSNEVSKAGFFDDSIGFSKAAVAAWWECDVSDYYKAKNCSITGDHDASDTCTGSSYHNVSESWKNKPERIEVWGAADYEGNGYVRFSATGGQITLNGGVYRPLSSRVIRGAPVGSMPSLKKIGKPGKEKPRYTLVEGSGTVRSLVYSLDPPTSIGHYTLTVDEGSALGDGYESSGGAYVEVSLTGALNPFKIVEVTGTIGASVEWNKGRQATSTGIFSNSWSWQVSEKNVCNAHDPPQDISGVHAHHWTCPTDNNGCGDHIQCGVPSSNIPDEHKLHASCWNSEYGCTEANVRKCTHDCEHGPPTCEGCSQSVKKADEHQKTCGNGHKYYGCNATDVSYHLTRICKNTVYRENSTSGWIPEDCNVVFADCDPSDGTHTQFDCPYYIFYNQPKPSSSRKHARDCKTCYENRSANSNWNSSDCSDCQTITVD